MPEFKIETFAGKVGILDPILDEFARYVDHWHIAEYEGSTELSEEARRLIEETEKPVLYIDSKGNFEFLPSDRFDPKDDIPIEVEDGFTSYKTLVRLDRLPAKYYPSGAIDSGVPTSLEFESSYKKLKSLTDLLNRGPFLNDIFLDPCIFNGARLVTGHYYSPENFMRFLTQSLIKRTTKDLSLEIYYDKLDISSNIVYLRNKQKHDFEAIGQLIKRIGGWPDIFINNDGCHLTCDFTISGKTPEEKRLAIVNNAFTSSKYTQEQERFMAVAYDAFGVVT